MTTTQPAVEAATYDCPRCKFHVIDRANDPDAVDRLVAWHEEKFHRPDGTVSKAEVTVEISDWRGGHSPNGLGIALVLALAILLALAAVVVAFAAPRLDGARLVAAPVLVVLAVTLAALALAAARRS